ncbi:MAG: SUKH-4 family immunity protein [Cyclobacteriaceae bacterium]
MLSPEKFRNEWEGPLIAYSENEIGDAKINQSNKDFLIKSGLPDDCAPFLSFNEKLYSLQLRSIKDSIELVNNDFDDKYVIGSDGSGGFIAIDGDDNGIKIFDHEYVGEVDEGGDLDFHENFIPIQFMNTSVGHLAGCLLAYRQFVSSARAARNNCAFSDLDLTHEELNELEQALFLADSECLKEKSFWHFELMNLS